MASTTGLNFNWGFNPNQPISLDTLGVKSFDIGTDVLTGSKPQLNPQDLSSWINPKETGNVIPDYLQSGSFLNTPVKQENNWLGSLGSMQGLGGLALGGGQLLLGLMSYLDQSKLADKQRQLLSQQTQANKYAMEKQKKNDEALYKAFHAGQTKTGVI